MKSVNPTVSTDETQSTTPYGTDSRSIPANPSGIENPNSSDQPSTLDQLCALDKPSAAATEQKSKSTPQAAGTPRIGDKRRKKRLDPVCVALGTAVFLFFVSTVFFAVAYLRQVAPQGTAPAVESPIERENRELHDTIAALEHTAILSPK